MNDKERPIDKIGNYVTLDNQQSSYSSIIYLGTLKFRRVSTDIVLGNIEEKDLKESITWFNFASLCALKKLLKHFDARQGLWKQSAPLHKEIKLR